MKRYILYIITALVATGCIENDIPYPVIAGNVVKMEVEGQTELKIDGAKGIVNLVLSDTVDLRAVKISALQCTDDSRSTLDSGDVIDLTDGVNYAIAETPYKFTISTFQDYHWQIVASQPIEREVVLSGSIGKASFDFENRVIVVKVAQSQDLYSIKVEKFKIGPSNAAYSPNPFEISNFAKQVIVTMSFAGMEEEWTIEVEHSFENVITGKANGWSRFAYLEGDILPTSAEKPAFEIRKKGTEAWSEVDATNKNGKITGIAKSLTPNTQYEFRARLGGEYGSEVEFQTQIEPTMPNLNFEDAYLGGSGNLVWYFNASPGGNSYWATGNEGVVISPGKSSTISVSGNEAVAGKAVRMETFNEVLLVKVAAGNIYTGTYQTNMSNPITSAVMGRPYTGRPTSFSGWFRYAPMVLTASSYKDAKFADSVGKVDWGHIYIVLEQWPADAKVRPAENLIKRIAYGEYRTNETVSTYKKFNIPITYYSLTDQPTHVIMTATSSINGAHFCGAAGSVMHVDEFELGFGYTQP